MASSGSEAKANYAPISTNEPVVSVDWLHSNLGDADIKVLDASWYMAHEQRNPIQEYQVAHIPGALFFDLNGIADRKTNRFPLIALASLLAVSFYVSVCATTKKYCILFELHVQLRHMLPSEEAFAAGCSALGIENNDGVVVYDGMGLFSAARVWWMFRVFGHDKVWVLDGGLPKWRASGYDVESSVSNDAILKASAATEAIEKIYQGQTISPITFQTKFRPHLVLALDQVKENIEDKTYQHIDARSKARFDGIAPEPWKGLPSGHIPGSKCVPFPLMFDSSQTLLPAEELKKQFEQEDISLDSPIAASCGTGVTACILALGLYRLGKTNVAIYDGSWTEWATAPNLPIVGSSS